MGRWKVYFALSLFLVLGVAMAIRADKREGKVVKPAVVSGRFYPEKASTLRKTIETFLADAVPVQVEIPLALVAPHAGYIYSGQIAADAYRQVAGRDIDLVLIMGANHTGAAMNTVAIYTGDGFETPLGVAWVAKDIVKEILDSSRDVTTSSAAHAGEHSVEVQVPFIQVLFPNAKIVPVVVGSHDVSLCTRFGETLGRILKGKKALIVASSDLSHYPAYDDAVSVDMETLRAIVSLDPAHLRKTVQSLEAKPTRDLYTAACGLAPVMVAQAAAKALGAQGAKIISYANSGDVPIGERKRVVGYGAVAMTLEKQSNPLIPGQETRGPGDDLSAADKAALLQYARRTIEQYVTLEMVPLARGFSAAAQQLRGAFVTLKKHGDLRGCIGHMDPDKPLVHQVGAMALQAALNDPRFPAVKAVELKDIEIEISVLTPMKPVTSPDDIVVGRDGVLLRKGGRSAVFLPQVATEQGWSRDEMLDHLAIKAGLPRNAWREGCQFFTFQAVVFSEKDLIGP